MNAIAFDSSVQGERRQYECVCLDVPGQLFDPLTDAAIECSVLNLSPGGAGVLCGASFPAGVKLVLHITTFGRFEGSVVPESSGDRGRVALAFSLSPSKRERVADMISLFVREGLASVTELRKSRRIRTNGSVDMVLEDGQSFACELVDISLDGVALRTRARPPLGELVRLGRTQGQVARYHDEGVAIRFIRMSSPIFLAN
jgi:hypothetical protein